MSLRVLIVDDDHLLRAGVRMILEAADGIDVAGEAANGRDAVEAAGELEPDVVLMDIRMPELDGIEATQRLLERSPDSKVIILTTFERDEYVFEALRAGASGFLLKRTSPETLQDAVRLVAEGDALLAPSVTRRLIESFVEQPSQPSTDAFPGFDLLTDREREVLVHVAAGKSNADLANDLFISEETAKTHVKRIFTKLGVRGRAQAVMVAYESGLVVPGAGLQDP